MREVVISETVLNKVSELKDYLLHELNLSKEAALNRTDRIERFIIHLGNLVDYPPCRFKRWREKGYYCAVFEKNWVSPTKYSPKALSSAICPIRQRLTILRISPTGACLPIICQRVTKQETGRLLPAFICSRSSRRSLSPTHTIDLPFDEKYDHFHVAFCRSIDNLRRRNSRIINS